MPEEQEASYYDHHCRRCGDRLDEDHSCDATPGSVAYGSGVGQRVKVIVREFRKSEMEHYGKTGDLIELDRSTGQARVTFDGGKTVTIDACCLQDQDSGEVLDHGDLSDVADPHHDPDAAWAAGDDWGPRGIARGYDSDSQ